MSLNINKDFKYYSLGLLISVSVLMDPKLLFVYILGGKSLGYLAFSLYSIILCTISFFFLSRSKFVFQFWLLFGFLIFGLILDLLRGLDGGTALLNMVGISTLPLAIVLYKKGYFTLPSITNFLFYFSVAHLFFIFYSLKNPQLLSQYTGYGDSDYLGQRAVGIFPAPGVLSFYSIIVFSYGLVVYRYKKGIINLIICFLGLILGFLSGNRAFIVAIIFLVLFSVLWSPVKKRKFAILRTVKIILIFILILWIIIHQFKDQMDLIVSRFKIETINEDYQTRLNGQVGLIPGMLSLSENPFIGNVIRDGGDLKVSLRGKKYSINNGYISIFGFNGIPAGVLFFSIFFSAFYRYRIFAKNVKCEDDNFILTAFYFMFMGASVVCFGDAFLKSPMMLILMIIPFSSFKELKQV